MPFELFTNVSFYLGGKWKILKCIDRFNQLKFSEGFAIQDNESVIRFSLHFNPLQLFQHVGNEIWMKVYSKKSLRNFRNAQVCQYAKTFYKFHPY